MLLLFLILTFCACASIYSLVDTYGCGATLIAEDIILTAAHCGLYGLENTQVSISAYKTSTGEGNAQSRFCMEWISHPNYDPNVGLEFDYDIALCKLDRPVTIDMTNATVQLNTDDTVAATAAANGETLTLLGTGKTEITVIELTPDKTYEEEFLKKVEVPVQTQAQCEATYLETFNNNMMCAGSSTADACIGDSGAPLLKREQQPDGSFVDTIVGMVSYGVSDPSCGTEPAVYNRIAPRWEWIVQAMCTNLTSSDSTVCPNATPFDSSCASDETLVVIGLQPDKFPFETSWVLKDSTNTTTLANRKRFVMRDTMSLSELCLPSGEDFYLTVTDFDGIEDNILDDELVYSVDVDGTRVITADGAFSGSETVVFSTPSAPSAPSAPSTPVTAAPTVSPTQAPVAVPEQCPADVMLVHQNGETALPDGVVEIIGRDEILGTIDVKVNQLFSETDTIDDVYYQYAEDFLHNDCYQQQNVAPGEHIAFTIKCTEGTKIALAELWLRDELLEGSASIPNCCHSTTSDTPVPVVKYMFEFSCVSKC